MNIQQAKYRQELRRVSEKYPPIKKPINQIIYGAPKGLKFTAKKYVYGAYTRQCPWKFDEIPILQYIGYSRGYYQFLACGDINYVILCKGEKMSL